TYEEPAIVSSAGRDPYRRDAATSGAPDRRALSGLRVVTGVRGPAGGGDGIDGPPGAPPAPQPPAPYRQLGVDRRDRLHGARGAGAPAPRATVGGVRGLPAVVPGDPERAVPGARRAVSRERRDAHPAPPDPVRHPRAPQHRAHRGHAPAHQGSGSGSRRGRRHGVVAAAPHDALRTVALLGLLRGAAL